MFSGLMSSFRGLMGWDNLEVEPGGNNEEKVQNNNMDERQSLFKQLSQFIGKDITSMISLPVWIFEPFSFLEVMCEPLQFEEALIKASTMEDPQLRIAYLAAWVVGGYSCAVRTKKPFNPLLGETFEYAPADKKWRFMAEQVSHHPPIGVGRAESDTFILELEMELKTKFTGNSSDVIVLGGCHFYTTAFKDHFTWNHLDTTAHNVIIGGMWVDHFGTLTVVNHTTGDKCILRVTKSGWLGSGRYEVQGEVVDAKGINKYKVSGKWHESLSAIAVNPDGTTVGESITLWKRSPPPPGKWNWTKFNDELNAVKDMEGYLPATDSRLRGDRRALENDDLSLAGKEKVRLEEEQRARKKAREAKGEHHTPKYFKSVEDGTGHKWEYTGNYWEERDQRMKEFEAKKSEKKEEKKEEEKKEEKTEGEDQ